MKPARPSGKGGSRRKRFLLWAAAALLLCLILPGLYNELRVAEYGIEVPGLAGTVRLAYVSDLHSCAYGEDMEELMDAIRRQSPDMVLLGGDLFDCRLPEDHTITFLRRVSEQYPCYFVTGNHEYRNGNDSFSQRAKILEQLGITRLSGALVTLEIHGVRLNLCGVDDPAAWMAPGHDALPFSGFREQLASVSALPREKGYTILLAHRPEQFDLYCDEDYDLVLAGHAHGGQWRIPGLINGLFAPQQGLFPAYAGGRYERDGTVMIVGRGLARENTFVPRFYNRPELVMVQLGPGE